MFDWLDMQEKDMGNMYKARGNMYGYIGFFTRINRMTTDIP